jgi:hypothetical protein
VLSVPPVDDQATVLPATPEPLSVYFKESVTASVLSAVADDLSADSVTPPQQFPA